MPKLILVRHGNTFEAGQTPTWVGGRTDMPLTATGEEQAQAIAKSITQLYAPISTIASGPLKRTRRVSEIIATATNTIFIVDERLTEIDFGKWENKSNQEIAALYGQEMLDDWNIRGLWPAEMNWVPSEDKLLKNVHNVLEEQHSKLLQPNAHHRVIVTSNGILRFVFSAVTGTKPSAEAKVGTGHYCVLEPTTEGWAIEKWNARP
ncbi:MAG: histidine phosphatase family protein [Proteobacteria bacterium]|jgi:probable phosphoglycerate mutase|nr:histidine phosphatase family protein [Alphaproteobacteria bacterium]NCC04116.1 histidine phosphatase family protein [Pseudomonadota bacterium]